MAQKVPMKYLYISLRIGIFMLYCVYLQIKEWNEHEKSVDSSLD